MAAHDKGLLGLLFLGIAIIVVKSIAVSFPRMRVDNREYKSVTIWAFCCAGGIFLAVQTFYFLGNYIEPG